MNKIEQLVNQAVEGDKKSLEEIVLQIQEVDYTIFIFS